MIEVSKFPNELEQKIMDRFELVLKENNVKFTKQYSPHPREHNRGIKYFVTHNFTKISFHIHNVSDMQ